MRYLTLILLLLTACGTDNYHVETLEVIKEVPIETLIQQRTIEVIENNDVSVTANTGVNKTEVNFQSPGGAGQYIYNNPTRNGNKGMLNFRQYDEMGINYFDGLSFEYRINNGVVLPYVNFQVDLNCDGFDLDQGDFILAKSATTISTNFTAFSVNKTTVMEKYPGGGNRTLQATPNACLVNAVTEDGGMPLTLSTGGIIVLVIDSTTITQFNVDVRSIIVDVKELQ